MRPGRRLVSSFPFRLRIEDEVRYALDTGEAGETFWSKARQQLVDDGVIGSDWKFIDLDTSRSFGL